MEMTHSSLHGTYASDSTSASVPFDVLRAIIAARQAASPTCRLFAARHGETASDAGVRQLIDLFARGRSDGDIAGGFASGQPTVQQDERHA
jgi:hypothetical protein